MLPKIPLYTDGTDISRVKFYKYGMGEAEGRDLSALGAFPKGERLRLVLSCPRTLGAAAVVLRIRRDGEASADIPFAFDGTSVDSGLDSYELILDTAALCGDCPSGLFYYELLFVRGADTLFSDSINNVDFALTPYAARGFTLLIHERDYAVPAWFGAGVMYHVFVDRFFCGAGEVDLQKGRGERPAILNPDWETGVPQYPDHPGAPLANNMFFGGNLWGVADKLDYLESLGVKVIYLSPIFKAYSNHKYDTGDYLTVDPGFGGEAAFRALLQKASERGIRVILDGVFNHTGDDSRYFNRYGTYPTLGAYQSKDSPYADWYRFHDFPEKFDSWWGIPILPKLDPTVRDCRHFFTGEEGVCAHYVREGIGGWRLDVADELSDLFLDELRSSVKTASEDEAVIIGEVWENAAHKIAYGYRRRYLQGKQLDSVMNYPVRNGILAFVKEGNAEALYHTLTELYASYPRCVSDALMNLLGTHDTERILTVLGSEPWELQRPNHELAHATLSAAQREKALCLLRMAATLQFTVFGIPSVYYGDEVGMEGYHDPFCRLPFPWHEVEGERAAATRTDLLDYYRALGELRRSPAFHGGDFRILCHGAHHVAYERISTDRETRYVIAANRGNAPVHLSLEARGELVLLSGSASYVQGVLTLGSDSVCVMS